MTIRRDNERTLREQEHANDPAITEPGYYLKEWRAEHPEENKFIDFTDYLNYDMMDEKYWLALFRWAHRVTMEYRYFIMVRSKKGRVSFKKKTHRESSTLNHTGYWKDE